MNVKTILVFSLLALVMSVSGYQDGFWIKVFNNIPITESLTFIPGQNIALSQDTKNKTITITGAATWSLSGLTTDNLSVNNINISGYISNDENDTYSEKAIRFDQMTSLWQYFLRKSDNAYSSFSLAPAYSFITVGTYPNIFTHEIDIRDNLVEINAVTNITGSLNLNGVNINESIIEKSSVRAFQADYLNESGIFSDIIIIPQNLTLTGISNAISKNNASNGTLLNFSLEKYTSYPNNKENVLNFTSSEYTKSASASINFNEDDILYLNYTTYINISTSNTLFKFRVR